MHVHAQINTWHWRCTYSIVSVLPERGSVVYIHPTTTCWSLRGNGVYILHRHIQSSTWQWDVYMLYHTATFRWGHDRGIYTSPLPRLMLHVPVWYIYIPLSRFTLNVAVDHIYPIATLRPHPTATFTKDWARDLQKTEPQTFCRNFSILPCPVHTAKVLLSNLHEYWLLLLSSDLLVVNYKRRSVKSSANVT